MPTVDQNQDAWNSTYVWTNQGDEWSEAWNSAEGQWWSSLMPRVHAYVRAGTTLEIAPGYGRWTQFLKDSCEKLVAVDLSAECIAVCQQRFADQTHIAYHVNDGLSLEMVADKSVDFVFSFDSLVHAEADVMESYVQQLARKLTVNGVGFLHHSNIGACDYFGKTDKLPRGKDFLRRHGLLERDHWRARSMTAALFRGYCETSGLQCITQELINWGANKQLTDCISVFTGPESRYAQPHRLLENPHFMQEASFISKYSPLYRAPATAKP